VETWLRRLGLLTGVACMAIGLYHFVFGIASVPGEALAGATVDSRERFYGAVFFGYGAAWFQAARQVPVSLPAVRWLAAILLAGGVGRVVSVAVHGWPHWFQTALAVVELVLPPGYLGLCAAVARSRRGP
jgi:hypothetical protein